MEINRLPDFNIFNIDSYALKSLVSKKKVNQNPMIRYIIYFIILTIIILTTLIVMKQSQIKEIQSKLEDIRTDITIIEAKIRNEIEVVAEEKDMRRSLKVLKEKEDSTIQSLISKKTSIEQTITKNNRERDYLIAYADDKNRELLPEKLAVKEKQTKIQQLRNEYTDLVAKLTFLNQNKPSKHENKRILEEFSLLTLNEKSFLESWTDIHISNKCFSSLNFGFDPSKFHMLCDFVGPTLFVFRINSNEIYAGFTTKSWGGIETKKDELAIIFNVSRRQAFRVIYDNYAITTDPNSFVQFGRDLVVQRDKGWSEFPFYYRNNDNNEKIIDKAFDVNLIEVFY